MRLNDNFHWIRSEHGAFLHWHYKCVALVRERKAWEAHCRVEIFTHPPIISRAGSVEQGVRHITRWVEKQARFPPMGR
jgi:hypothetical protein